MSGKKTTSCETSSGASAATEDNAVGYLLDILELPRRGSGELSLIGKLADGRTFQILDNRNRPFFYVHSEDLKRAQGLLADLPIETRATPRHSMDGQNLACLFFERSADQRKAAELLKEQNLATYEADVSLTSQYLMAHGIRGSLRILGTPEKSKGNSLPCLYRNPGLAPAEWAPDLSVLSFDIETDEAHDSQILGVSLVGFGPKTEHHYEQIHIVGESLPDDPDYLHAYPTEGNLLTALARRVREYDPDILTGWNVIDFDLSVLAQRYRARRIPFCWGRTDEQTQVYRGERWGGSRVRIRGRQVLDALHLVRATMQRFEDFRLDTVSNAILGRGKKVKEEFEELHAETIARMYHEDRAAFCEYCLEDARLVRDLVNKEGLIDLTVRRGQLTGLPLERAWGSIAAFDFLYLGELHKQGFAAPSLGVDRVEGGGAPGGLVMSARAGLYRNVWVFDYRSLYPSIMRTFNIDPLCYTRTRQPGKASNTDDSFITAPNGARFVRDPGILPGLLDTFFTNRDRAKAEGNQLASFVYKILMNSFYGVLASNACRFASGKLAGAITEFGHYFLRWTRDYFEKAGHRVLYGDTDSVFVEAQVPEGASYEGVLEMGQQICQQVNAELKKHIEQKHGVISRLELEFEKTYLRFFLPPGAKRYAGLRRVQGKPKAELEIVGLEAVRRDWTDLAGTLQRELLEKIFQDTPIKEIEAFLAEKVRALKRGELDELLIYRKGLRKPVSEYTRTTPPHVKAAKLLNDPNPRGVIRYLVTKAGPQPLGHIRSPIDYQHYIDKQISPIVEMLSPYVGIVFKRAMGDLTLWDLVE